MHPKFHWSKGTLGLVLFFYFTYYVLLLNHQYWCISLLAVFYCSFLTSSLFSEGTRLSLRDCTWACEKKLFFKHIFKNTYTVYIYDDGHHTHIFVCWRVLVVCQFAYPVFSNLQIWPLQAARRLIWGIVSWFIGRGKKQSSASQFSIYFLDFFSNIWIFLFESWKIRSHKSNKCIMLFHFFSLDIKS